MKVRTDFLLTVLLAVAVYVVAGLDDDNKRIVGGDFADILNHKHLVQLWYLTYCVCGGTLVSKEHVVTAAHCVRGTTAKAFTINAASSYVSQSGEVRKIARYWMHPQYNNKSQNNDIAVLKLSQPLTGAQVAIAPLCSSNLLAGDQVRLAGWGAISEGGPRSDRLRAVNLQLVSRETCKKVYPGKIKTSMLCATSNGKDACKGDSGSPLMKNGEFCGIVSWGRGCSRPNFPKVYTNVNAMKSFIKSMLKL